MLDAILIASSVAERAVLPIMINMDAFYLTHTSEVLDVPDQEKVDIFLPPYQPSSKLNVDDPKTLECVRRRPVTSIRYKRHCDTLALEKLSDRAAAEFCDHFDRVHATVETYRTEDADVCIVGMGPGAAPAAGSGPLKGRRIEGWLHSAFDDSTVPRERFKRAIANAKHLISLIVTSLSALRASWPRR